MTHVFIKLEATAGYPIYLNVANITSITRYSGFTDVRTTANDSGFEVSEKPSEIMQLIGEATTPPSVPSLPTYNGPVMLEKEMD